MASQMAMMDKMTSFETEVKKINGRVDKLETQLVELTSLNIQQ